MFRVLRGNFAEYRANIKENTVISSQQLLLDSRILRDILKDTKQQTRLPFVIQLPL
jgi:hypothetical protein